MVTTSLIDRWLTSVFSRSQFMGLAPNKKAGSIMPVNLKSKDLEGLSMMEDLNTLAWLNLTIRSFYTNIHLRETCKKRTILILLALDLVRLMVHTQPQHSVKFNHKMSPEELLKDLTFHLVKVKFMLKFSHQFKVLSSQPFSKTSDWRNNNFTKM